MKRSWLDSWLYVLSVAIMFNDDLNEQAKEWARKRKAEGKSYKMRDYIIRNMSTILNHPNLEDCRRQYYAEKAERDSF